MQNAIEIYTASLKESERLLAELKATAAMIRERANQIVNEN